MKKPKVFGCVRAYSHRAKRQHFCQYLEGPHWLLPVPSTLRISSDASIDNWKWVPYPFQSLSVSVNADADARSKEGQATISLIQDQVFTPG